MINDTESTIFLTLAKNLSFTKTAKELYMTHQTVSRTVKQLEARLGVRLLERTTRTVKLTSAGKQYYGFLLETAGRYNSTLCEMHYNQDEASGSFLIACQDVLPYDPAAILATRQLIKKNPGTWINMFRGSANAMLQLLKDGTCDVAIIGEQYLSRDSALEWASVVKAPQSLMVAADYPGGAERDSWSDFSGEPIILDSLAEETEAQFTSRSKQFCERIGLSKSPVICVPTREMCYNMAELGCGIVVGTTGSMISRRRNLKAYQMEHCETVLAVWNKKGKKPLVSKLVSALTEEYKHFSDPSLAI